MLHHPSGAARGQASDLHHEARELMRLRTYVNNVLANATGQPVEKVKFALHTSPIPTSFYTPHFTPFRLQVSVIHKRNQLTD
jgi:hypothetical protein